MSISMLRLACLPAAALAFGCEDGSCAAAHLLQVDSQKVQKIRRSSELAHKEEAVSVASVVPPSTEIKVIMAGYGRSASTSMECALMHLGFNPNRGDLLYRKYGTLMPVWMQWVMGGSFEPALEQLLSLGFNATSSDLPTGIAWRELHEHFPKAKVINLLHPGGVEGFVKDVPHDNFLICRMWYMKYFVACCDMSKPWTTEQRLERCSKEYTDEHEKIVNTVPPENLLTYSVKEGWDPLVKFLELPAPDIEFPNLHGAQIQMCYPDKQPEILYDDMIMGVDGLLSPEGLKRGQELQEQAKSRLLNPEELIYVTIYQESQKYVEEALQTKTQSSELAAPAP